MVHACGPTVARGLWAVPSRELKAHFSSPWSTDAQTRTGRVRSAQPIPTRVIFFFLSQSSSQAQARQSCERWKMAGKLDPSEVAPSVVLEEAEGSEGKWASGGPGRRKGGFVPLQ